MQNTSFLMTGVLKGSAREDSRFLRAQGDSRPLHVGVVLLQDVPVGGSVGQVTTPIASADMLSFCGASPVDAEVWLDL